MRARQIEVRDGDPSPGDFALDVRKGLVEAKLRTLPPRWLYDELGSMLFEAITRLPEYGVWRAERRLIARFADALAEDTDARFVVELGSGSANKTRELLAPLIARHAIEYAPVEISPTALESTVRELSALDRLEVRPIEADYLGGLAIASKRRRAGTPMLILFLGGSIGNLDGLAALHFLKDVRKRCSKGDRLLLGADLVKPAADVLAAYDDALGVTAAFNLNVLQRMNRELGANFVVSRFRHRARYDSEHHNIEMHIESLCDQIVEIDALDATIALRSGETIHTETSHKFSLDELEALFRAGGWRQDRQWCDEEWPFSATLLSAV